MTEVKLLNNDPGLFSARYSGKNTSDEKNISKLLKKTEGLKNKAAKFISTLAFYDPIFKLKNSNKTLAEVSFEERMKISHRSISTRKMITHLRKIYK